MRVVHLYERRVAGVDWHPYPHQRLEPVGVGRARGPDHEAEGARAGMDVERVLHRPLLAAEEHHVEGCVAGRRDDLGRESERSLVLSQTLKRTIRTNACFRLHGRC